MARCLIHYCRECGSQSSVIKSERIHKDTSRIYFRCKNPDCQHQFVMNLEFSHSTRASKMTEEGILHYLVEKLPLNQIQNLQKVLENHLNKVA